jgi:hypothetical protein
MRDRRSHTIVFAPGPAGQAIKNGISISFQAFKSVEDEVPVQRSVETYPSARRARISLRDEIKRSSKLLEHSKAVKEEVDERAVILRKLSKRESEFIIIWRQGAKLHAISSPSLEHALAFEQQKERGKIK